MKPYNSYNRGLFCDYNYSCKSAIVAPSNQNMILSSRHGGLQYTYEVLSRYNLQLQGYDILNIMIFHNTANNAEGKS